MKTIWIIANWKSNKTVAEALDWVSVVGPELLPNEHVKVVVCPEFTSLEEVKKAVLVGNYHLMVGAQDLSPFDTGAYTGEEPAKLISQFASLVILGHSERRQNFNETDEMVKEKAEMARKYNLTPLVCIQSSKIPIPEETALVAYEPIFAIGTGNPDTPEDAGQAAGEIKQINGGLDVLYGGSVDAQNAEFFLQQDNLSGLLIGKASLDADEFLKIVKIAYSL